MYVNCESIYRSLTNANFYGSLFDFHQMPKINRHINPYLVHFIADVIDLRLNEFIVDVDCLLYSNFDNVSNPIDTVALFLLPFN